MSSIGVQSIPELYGFALGWIQYNHAWHLLTLTGLVFLPFIGLLFKHSVGPYLSKGVQAASSSLRAVSIECISALLVIMLACVPCLPIKVHHAQQNTHTASNKLGNTQTTYDDAFALDMQSVTSVRVPLWWYGVIALSEGITSALVQQLGDVPDLRGLIVAVQLTRIDSPTLRKEIKQFYGQCYIPARQAWLKADKTTDLLTQYHERYGANDTEWMGSHTFIQVPGYYTRLHAAQSIVGFSFDPSTDWQAAQVKKKPPWGRPTCADWWLDAEHGLRTRLLATLPMDTVLKIKLLWREQSAAIIDQALQQLLNPNSNCSPTQKKV